MHIILHLNSDKRPQSHTNRYGKSESVNSRSDHIPWQQIAGQSRSCRAAHRVNRPIYNLIITNAAKKGKSEKREKRDRKAAERQNILYTG